MRFETAEQFIKYITNRPKQDTPNNDLEGLLEKLDHPELKLKCIHVAGTNGKGSTTDYLRSILQSHGYKVGTFTSPHLVVHNDRIRINNEYIPDEKLLEYGNRFADDIVKYDLFMFQIDLLISFYYFLEEKVDYVVYEVGLGGRYDATNVIKPLISVITNIGMDHMKLLGDTHEKIAWDKGGIIKEKIPVMTGERKKGCLQVFDDIAEEMHTSVMKIRAPKGQVRDGKVCFSYHGYDIVLDTLADYQVKNAALALRVADYLMINKIIPLDKEDIINGLQNTSWAGRFEVLVNHPLIIVDGAHNIHGINALKDSLKNLDRPICIIASILRDKQYEKMLKVLESVADELIVSSFNYKRAASQEELVIDDRITSIPDYKEALKYAVRKYASGSIVICGSLYFVSEIRKYIVEEYK